MALSVRRPGLNSSVYPMRPAELLGVLGTWSRGIAQPVRDCGSNGYADAGEFAW